MFKGRQSTSLPITLFVAILGVWAALTFCVTARPVTPAPSGTRLPRLQKVEADQIMASVSETPVSACLYVWRAGRKGGGRGHS